MAQTQPVGAARVPQRRRTSAVQGVDNLVNARSDMRYVLAAAGTPLVGGVDYYTTLGYSVVTKEKGGVDILAGSKTRKPGEEITHMGLVLMQIPKEDWDSINAYGISGEGGGQELCDTIENRLRDRKQDIREITDGRQMNTREGDVAFHMVNDQKPSE